MKCKIGQQSTILLKMQKELKKHIDIYIYIFIKLHMIENEKKKNYILILV